MIFLGLLRLASMLYGMHVKIHMQKIKNIYKFYGTKNITKAEI